MGTDGARGRPGHCVVDMTRRRVLAATLIAAAAATTLAGCGGVGATLTFSDVAKVKVTEIKMTGSSGNVMVKTAALDPGA